MKQNAINLFQKYDKQYTFAIFGYFNAKSIYKFNFP